MNTLIITYRCDPLQPGWQEDIMDRTVILLANLCNYAIPATSILDIRLDHLVIEALLLPVLKENSDSGRLLHKVRSGR